jgi:hypothetical protein
VLQKAHGNAIKPAIGPQVPQPQKPKRTSWEPRRGASGVSPERRRLATLRASRARAGKSRRSGFPAGAGAARAASHPGAGRANGAAPLRRVRRRWEGRRDG